MNVLSPAIHASYAAAHDSAPQSAGVSDHGDFLHFLRQHAQQNGDDTPSQTSTNSQQPDKQDRDRKGSNSDSKSDSAQHIKTAQPVSEEVDTVALSLNAAAAPLSIAAPVTAPLHNNPVTTAGIAPSAPSPTDSPDATQPLAAQPLLTPQPVLGNLAFALRVQTAGGESDAQNEPASQPGTNIGNAASLLTANVQLAASGPEHKSDTQIAGILAIDPNSGHHPPSTGSQTQTSADTSAPTRASSDFEAELNKFRAVEPVRGAHVQISGADSQRVDIRLVERGGSLSVTVRSGDATLARSLQEHAPELNASLHLEHFHTELWTPSASRSSFQQQSGSQSETSYSGNGGGNQQQQNKKNQQQPEWIDEIESHSAALQKRIDYSWHQ